MEYINTITEYWFEKREKLKQRSLLHRLLLEKQEKQKERDQLLAYLKKFKPAKFKEYSTD